MKSCSFCKHLEFEPAQFWESCANEAEYCCRKQDETKIYFEGDYQEPLNLIQIATKCKCFEWDEEILKFKKKEEKKK